VLIYRPKWHPLEQAFIGVPISTSMAHVLRRTAREIEWHLDAIQKIENVLLNENLRPYLTRRSTRLNKPAQVHYILGYFLPNTIIMLWLFLLLTPIFNTVNIMNISNKACILGCEQQFSQFSSNKSVVVKQKKSKVNK